MNELPPRRSSRHGHSDASVDHAVSTDDGMSQHDFTSMADVESENRADAALPRGTDSARLPLKAVILAALVGTAAASAVFGGALIWIIGQEDPRLGQLAHRNADLTLQVRELADKLRILETGHVASEETSNKLAAALVANGGEIRVVKSSLDQLVAQTRLSSDEKAGVSAPALFGVAVLQLREAVQVGRRFDWELVNLRGIVGDDAALLAQITLLAPMAMNGVPTDQQLADDLRMVAARANPSGTALLLTTGINAFSRVFRNAPANVSASTNSRLLGEASSRLAESDYVGATRNLAALSGSVAWDARDLVEASRRRATAQNAVDILSRAAREGLEKQMRAAMLSPSATAR